MIHALDLEKDLLQRSLNEKQLARSLSGISIPFRKYRQHPEETRKDREADSHPPFLEECLRDTRRIPSLGWVLPVKEPT